MTKQETIILLDEVKELRGDIKTLLQKVAALEVKSGVWGMLGGMAIYSAAFIVNLFSSHQK